VICIKAIKYHFGDARRPVRRVRSACEKFNWHAPCSINHQAPPIDDLIDPKKAQGTWGDDDGCTEKLIRRRGLAAIGKI
jgi:hypothetical protein